MKKQLQHTPLSHLPLRPSTLQLLQSRGFSTWQDVEETKAGGMGNLATELGVSSMEAANVCREIQLLLLHNENHIQPKTVSQILLEATSNGTSLAPSSIITFCRQVDQLLGGGIALGELTEIAGLPGAGKTQFGMQLAVTARLPVTWGGVQGETLYIDSEGSFAPERCWNMATALVTHIQNVQKRRVPHNETPSWFTAESILQGIHVLRVHDEAAQTATLVALESILHDRMNIKLIVMDSMAFHYRASHSKMESSAESAAQQRTLLVQLANHLSQIAAQRKVAVVTMNQMTTTKTPAGDFVVVPALGEAWAHAVTTRLLLVAPSTQQQQCRQVRRTCELTKSPRLPSGKADFTITEAGIRGADDSSKRTHDQMVNKAP